MKRITQILGLLLLVALLSSSCDSNSSPEPTVTEVTTTAAPTETPFWDGPCDPSTEQIEMDTRLTKGVGAGYTPPGKICSVYCIHVPEGSQLLIGIADLDYQLNFTVGRELFPNWNPGLRPHRGMLAGTRRIIVNPRTEVMDPSGRYYIYVCLDEGSGEFWRDNVLITFPEATTFTLYNEFTP